MLYVPNVGELEMLKSILAAEGLILGLYANAAGSEGALVIGSLTELPTGGGRGYAQIALDNALKEGVAAADTWALTTDVNGKAAASFDNVTQNWTFTSVDVSDGLTAYGVFGYTWVVPFDAGAVEIKPGDKIKGATSAATGIVTSVILLSGSWAGGTAAGELRIKTKTGTFQNNENLIIAGAIATGTIAAGGTGYALGDIITVTQTGASGAKIVVTAVDGYGAITDFVIVDGGQGYSAASGLATVAITGSGNDDATFTVSTLAATVLAVSNTDTTADAHKRLMFIDPFSTPQPITPAGFQIQYPAAITLSSAA